MIITCPDLIIHQPGFKSIYNSYCTPPRCGRVGLKKTRSFLLNLVSLFLCKLWSENTISSHDAKRRDPTRREPAPARQTRQAARDRQPSPPRQAALSCVCTELAASYRCSASQPLRLLDIRWHDVTCDDLLAADLHRVTQIRDYYMTVFCL